MGDLPAARNQQHYPGRKALRARATAACEPLAARQARNSSFDYFSTFATKAEWLARERTIHCWLRVADLKPGAR